MAIAEGKNIKDLINKSSNILIVCEQNYSVDGVSSALALYDVLKKQGKDVTVVSDTAKTPDNLSFLSGITDMISELKGLQQTIISLDTSKKKVSDFSYDVQDGKLKIFLTPEYGSIEAKDMDVSSTGYKYDLIITTDVDDLPSVGSIFEKNTEFFYNTPIINFGHTTENEHFGQVNLVDIAKTSVAEILFDVLEQEFKNSVDHDIATALLTGLISKTKGFKSQNVTPRSLQVASTLIENGANRELIIQKLYQTKSIETLKLWGTTLSRLKKEPQHNIAWSYIGFDDFESLNATPESLREIIEELIINAPEAKIVSIFYEYPRGKNKALLYSAKEYDSLQLAKTLSPFGNKMFAQFELHKSDLLDGAKEAISAVKEQIK